jgi:hypothetical protein
VFTTYIMLELFGGGASPVPGLPRPGTDPDQIWTLLTEADTWEPDLPGKP